MGAINRRPALPVFNHTPGKIAAKPCGAEVWWLACGGRTMDLGNIPLFKAMMSRMSWLSERQQVLAQNVANADTPNFKPRDLTAQSFRDMIGGSPGGATGGSTGPLQLAATQPNHLTPTGGAPAFRAVVDRSAETSPSGNGVSVEDQMLKVAETANQFQLTTNLYRRHIAMLKTVLGRTA
jgi:flagellar basal-body rod protein FlgB